MWLAVNYEPVAIFGLRPSNTTSSGGKSLIAPTPYAIKMAILDRMIRYGGLNYGVGYFPAVRDLKIWFKAPLAVAVNRSFQKILRPDGKVWKETIVQREYISHAGQFTLAFEISDNSWIQELELILPAINYFGRKGSFMQYIGQSSLPNLDGQGFINLCVASSEQPSFGFLQRMDDMHSQASFVDVSVYENSRSDGGRVTYNVIFPYRLVYHGFNHTIYEVEQPS